MKSSPLKRTKGIKPISDRMRVQRALEAKLKQELLNKCEGRCMYCGLKGHSNAVLSKHEIVFRSKGLKSGNPLDPMNCIILCPWCHEMAQRRIISAEDLTKARQEYEK